jgi:C1A family cysteine protease
MNDDKGRGWVISLSPITNRSKIHTSALQHSTLERNPHDEDLRSNLPHKIDFREECSPIRDQGRINSASAHAVVGMVEHFQNKHFGYYIDGSTSFLYTAARILLQLSKDNDCGVPIRTAMYALTSFGLPDEKYHRSFNSLFDKQPESHVYSLAKNFKAKDSERLDRQISSGKKFLIVIKRQLSKGTPIAFGFAAYDKCILQADTLNGKIPYPSPRDTYTKYHSVMTVGYDDALKINNIEGTRESTGALIVRNSWGDDWGDRGYGYLPYEYILSGLTQDWWILLKLNWIDVKLFE